MIQCTLCGKRVLIGSDSTHKHSGAWAMRAPKSRKVWKPNLKYLRIAVGGGAKKRMRLCVACIKQYRRTQKPIGIAAAAQVASQAPDIPQTIA